MTITTAAATMTTTSTTTMTAKRIETTLMRGAENNRLSKESHGRSSLEAKELCRLRELFSKNFIYTKISNSLDSQKISF